MKQCPKCNASVGDTAKFCVKCGCNIKKFEEENALGREIFCPECGTKFSGGAFCPECGYNASEALQGNETTSSADTFEDFFADIEESAATAVEDIMTQEEIERQKKALSMFEYEEDGDDTYIVFGIKNKNAIKITIPYGTVAIADGAFEDCKALSVTLPEGLIKIGDAAFKNSKDLAVINLPDSLLSIGEEAFAGCETLDVVIPGSPCKVGKDAFLNTIPYKKEWEAEVARIAQENKWAQEAEAARIAKEEQLAQEAEAARVATEKEAVRKTRLLDAKIQYFNDLYGVVPSEVTFSTTEYEYSLFGKQKGSYQVQKTENLRWVVIDADTEKVLLMAKDWENYKYAHYGALSSIRRFLPSQFDTRSNLACCTWENSGIRAWLNDEFYKIMTKSFGNRIVTTTLDNGDDLQTNDKIFLLSAEELKQYKTAILKQNCRVISGCSCNEYVFLRSVDSANRVDVFRFEVKFKEDYSQAGMATDIEFGRSSYSDHHAFLPVMWVKHTDEMLKKIQSDQAEGKLYFLD